MAGLGNPFLWLDVFAEAPLQGNGLAVVLDADGVDDPTMLAFARETGLSETTFVQSATAEAAEEGADYRNRIWTISGEIPFAGHPSLGTAVAVAIQGGVESATFTQQTEVGLQEVDVVRSETGGSGPEAWQASVHQEKAEFGDLVAADR
ncbi:MAG: PhzF family phenazine biosynthesis protein, partial [Solirubrobacterales bacterium]|nr:PhzF family phenazine biosynthesis protein [Solirubrobacterales bacterium]